MQLNSTAFTHGGDIPRKYTCQGDDVSPALNWSDVPDAAESLALIVEDPDAPDPAKPQRIWVHWVLVDLPPSSGGLPEGADPLPRPARSGMNDWHRESYGGPCPPIGKHRYFFRLYALDRTLPDLSAPTKSELLQAMHQHVLAQAELMGTYEKRN